ncbi:RecX family transcriptional regulator [Allosphingosinicella flava]|uniref:RecX family transcriptional regulator n=1 Tax=Allosphingosinicella flava TaxID=2771430 RepID=UPI001CF7B103|nr:RecX family transcriptional regulator [Sphingosinicella flava]
MAQSWRVNHRRHKSARPPIDAAGLERLALHYVGRYATSRAKLRAYLHRKIAERGWQGDDAAPVEALVERIERLGYVDDRAFAAARAASLGRKGYGPRRVHESLRAAGIGEEEGEEARSIAAGSQLSAALAFARRKRIGPFASAVPDRPGREKALAAMLRAGHGLDVARRVVDAMPGDVPEEDSSGEEAGKYSF